MNVKVAQSSLRGLPKTQTWRTVMTGICPSFRFGVSFRPIVPCLILNWLLGAH